jgi:hypothetical protein
MISSWPLFEITATSPVSTINLTMSRHLITKKKRRRRRKKKKPRNKGKKDFDKCTTRDVPFDRPIDDQLGRRVLEAGSTVADLHSEARVVEDVRLRARLQQLGRAVDDDARNLAGRNLAMRHTNKEPKRTTNKQPKRTTTKQPKDTQTTKTIQNAQQEMIKRSVPLGCDTFRA